MYKQYFETQYPKEIRDQLISSYRDSFLFNKLPITVLGNKCGIQIIHEDCIACTASGHRCGTWAFVSQNDLDYLEKVVTGDAWDNYRKK